MKLLLPVFIFCVVLVQNAYCQKDTKNIPLPSPQQLTWQQKECIMFVHYGPAAWQGNEYDNFSTPLNMMNPTKLNTDQWCQVAKSWGAKTIIFVAKHVGGFCWWQTQTSDYGVRNIPWRNGHGDVLKELSQSCKKYGLDLGIYLYPGDEHWGLGVGGGGLTKDPKMQETYNAVFRQQLTEVLSRYGDIKEVWFDGNCQIEVGDILKKYAPNAVVFQGKSASLRWVGNEDGSAPDPNWYTLNGKDLQTGVATSLHSDVNGNSYAPVEIDVPFLNNRGHKWFWAPNTDSLMMSVPQLMNLYYKSVGRGSVLLLNSTPDTSGLIPAEHVQVYKAFGDEIQRRFSTPLARTQGHTRELTLTLSKPMTVNHTIIREDLSNGQRVMAYKTEYSIDGKIWKPLFSGTSVGNKKIDRFPEVIAKAVRLTIVSDKDIPYISDFSVYDVQISTLEMAQSEANSAVHIGYWEANTYNTEEWKKLEINLTDNITSVGQYELYLNTLSYDYNSGKPSGLEFKDAKLQMYGHDCPDAISISNDGYQYVLTRSQQIGDKQPVIFSVMVKSREAKSAGEIMLKKISY